MIQSANNKILVKVDMSQKDYMEMGGSIIKSAKEYDPNYRERSQVIAEAMETVGEIKEHDLLLCHHNMFYGNSPYWLKEDLFSIPCKQTTIFAKLDKEGNPKPILGNVLGERVLMPFEIEIPPELRKYYLDRVKVISNGFGYKKGQLIFHRLYAWYEIIYTWGIIEKRVIKVNTDMIIGYEV